MKQSKYLNINIMIKISILSILALIFTMVGINIIFFPSFLKLDIGNVPAMIATLTINLYVGIFVELIKNILKFILDNDTGGVGELANFILGVVYLLPFSIIYKKFKSIKSYILSSIISIFIMSIVAAILNYFILLPLYAKFLDGMDLIISMANSINSSIKDIKSLILIAIIPFNILKGIIISIVSYLLYKYLKRYIK